MMRALWRMAVAATLVAGGIGAWRQRQEAMAVRRGELEAASASADVPPRASYGVLAGWLSEWTPAPPRTPFGRAAASAWAAPLTLVGIGLALLSGRRPVWDRQLRCFVVTGMRGPSRTALRAMGAQANTIGQIVLATHDAPSPVLLAHEAMHARQAERFGPLLFPAYVWLGARYGYRDNPFERAARLGARRSQVRRVEPDATGDQSSDAAGR